MLSVCDLVLFVIVVDFIFKTEELPYDYQLLFIVI